MSFMAKFKTKPGNAPPPPAKRIQRSADWFVKLHDRQLEAIFGFGSFAYTCLYLVFLAMNHTRILLARLLWRLSERLTHYANALFIRTIQYRGGRHRADH
jgi:hypothetical protein